MLGMDYSIINDITSQGARRSPSLKVLCSMSAASRAGPDPNQEPINTPEHRTPSDSAPSTRTTCGEGAPHSWSDSQDLVHPSGDSR